MRGAGRHLFLLKELVRRDFHGRYAGSLFGFLWSFAHPLWLLLLYSFVFSTVMKIPLHGERTDRFWVFLFSGMLPWLAVQEGVLRATTAITDNAELVKKLRFPSSILVLAVVVTGLLHEGIAAVVFGTALTVLGELSWGSLGWILVALPFQIALTVGLGLTLATVHVFFRDTSQLLTMVLTGWFFVTPIVYPLAMVGEPYSSWIELNPLTGLVDLYRRALYGGGEAGGSQVAVVVSAVAAIVFGSWLFSRAKSAFVDEI